MKNFMCGPAKKFFYTESLYIRVVDYCPYSHHLDRTCILPLPGDNFCWYAQANQYENLSGKSLQTKTSQSMVYINIV